MQKLQGKGDPSICFNSFVFCLILAFFFFIATGSDIGSDDIIAGNVSKYAVLPPGYCGQPKKGHLIFDACFESGKYLQCFVYNALTFTILLCLCLKNTFSPN